MVYFILGLSGLSAQGELKGAWGVNCACDLLQPPSSQECSGAAGEMQRGRGEGRLGTRGSPLCLSELSREVKAAITLQSAFRHILACRERARRLKEQQEYKELMDRLQKEVRSRLAWEEGQAPLQGTERGDAAQPAGKGSSLGPGGPCEGTPVSSCLSEPSPPTPW